MCLGMGNTLNEQQCVVQQMKDGISLSHKKKYRLYIETLSSIADRYLHDVILPICVIEMHSITKLSMTQIQTLSLDQELGKSYIMSYEKSLALCKLSLNCHVQFFPSFFSCSSMVREWC